MTPKKKKTIKMQHGDSLDSVWKSSSSDMDGTKGDAGMQPGTRSHLMERAPSTSRPFIQKKRTSRPNHIHMRCESPCAVLAHASDFVAV